MSRIKLIRPTALLLCILLAITAIKPAFAADSGFRPDDEDLYFSALNEEIKEDVKTIEVARGDFVVMSSCKAEIEYDRVSYVFNNLAEGSVKYVKMLVSSGDWVHRGDRLVQVSTTVETADLDALRTEIEVEEQNLEEFMSVNRELMDKYTRIIATSSNANERRMAELLYERLTASFEDEYDSRTKSIEQKISDLDRLENSDGTLYITAESEGEVREINRYRNGDTLRSWAYICTICDTRSFRVRVSGGVSGLYYNMPVTVTQAQSKGAASLEGRVTTCKSSVLAPNLIGSTDYIEILGDMETFEYGSDVTVSYRSTDMKDVLVVNKSAVYHDSKGDYVYVYTNGNSIKRYVQTGGNNATVVWIVNGLVEGDLVVIK